MTEWEEQKDAELVEFQKDGDNVEGTLVAVQPDVGKFKSKLYSLRKEDGAVVKFWGSKVLDDRMIGIPFGTMIKVVYKGTEKTEDGTEYKSFSVFKAKKSN